MRRYEFAWSHQIAGLLYLPSRTECPIDRPFPRKSPFLPHAQTRRGPEVSVEYVRGCIHHTFTVPAPDLHSRGVNMSLDLVLAPKSCMTAAAEPLVILLVFESRTPLAGSQGDEVVPFGVGRILSRVLELGCRFPRHGHERAKRISGTTRGDRRVKLTLDSVRSRDRGPGVAR